MSNNPSTLPVAPPPKASIPRRSTPSQINNNNNNSSSVVNNNSSQDLFGSTPFNAMQTNAFDVSSNWDAVGIHFGLCFWICRHSVVFYCAFSFWSGMKPWLLHGLIGYGSLVIVEWNFFFVEMGICPARCFCRPLHESMQEIMIFDARELKETIFWRKKSEMKRLSDKALVEHGSLSLILQSAKSALIIC